MFTFKRLIWLFFLKFKMLLSGEGVREGEGVPFLLFSSFLYSRKTKRRKRIFGFFLKIDHFVQKFGLHCDILVSNVGFATLSSKMRLCVVKVMFFFIYLGFGEKGGSYYNFLNSLCMKLKCFFFSVYTFIFT